MSEPELPNYSPLRRLDKTDWKTPDHIDGGPALLFAAVSMHPKTGHYRVQWRTRDVEEELRLQKIPGLDAHEGAKAMRGAVLALYISLKDKMRDMEIPVP